MFQNRYIHIQCDMATTLLRRPRVQSTSHSSFRGKSKRSQTREPSGRCRFPAGAGGGWRTIGDQGPSARRMAQLPTARITATVSTYCTYMYSLPIFIILLIFRKDETRHCYTTSHSQRRLRRQTPRLPILYLYSVGAEEP